MNLFVASADAVLSPLLIIVLCALAAIGTVLMLPKRRERAISQIGGTISLVSGAILVATLVRVAAGQNPPDPMGIYFWIFSAIAVFASLRVVTHSQPVYSALYFVLTVFASAGLFVLLWAEFMAMALILIYAGAILVTYVFVIMLAARSGSGSDSDDCDQMSREPVAASVIGFGLLAVLLYVVFDRAPAALAAQPAAPKPGSLSVKALAEYLFQSQLVNLEVAGVLLTMAMVGAIVIARRRLWSAKPEVHEVHAVTIGDDNPHAVPVTGTTNPRQKAYPES